MSKFKNLLISLMLMWPPEAAAHVTVVTALFHVGREHQSGISFQVSDWFKEITDLNVSYVVFVDKNLTSSLKAVLARSFQVSIIENEFHDLPYHKFTERIETVLSGTAFPVSGIREQERFESKLAIYNTLQYSRFEWLRFAAESNPFNSSFFFWMDVGSSLFSGVAKRSPWPCADLSLAKDRLLIQARDDMVDFALTDDPAGQQAVGYGNLFLGALFGGSVAVVKRLADDMQAMLEESLRHRVVPNEQVALTMLWRRRPQFFQIMFNSSGVSLFDAMTCPIGPISWLPDHAAASTQQAPDTTDPSLSFWQGKCDVKSWKTYAVATFLSSAEYVSGANVLKYSIEKYLNTSVFEETTFIALLIQDKPDNIIIKSSISGWDICTVPLIPPPFDGATATHFREQFTKLVLWNFTMFQRIMYIDSDCVVLKDFSAMLVKPTSSFAAVHDWEQGKIREHFNMGVCSLRPNQTEFRRLNDLRETERGYRMEMAEQGLLNAVYKNVTEYFPFEYNGNLAAATQNLTFWDEHFSRLRVIHFTWAKPFKGGTCDGCASAIGQWHSLKAEMEAKARAAGG